MLVFTDESAQIEKLQTVMKKTSVERTSEAISKFDDVKSEEPATKKRRINGIVAKPWICVDNMILTAADKTIILSNEELNDKHIYVAQKFY